MTSCSIGIEKNHVFDIKEEIKRKNHEEADFIVVPLFHPRFRRDCHGVSASRLGPITRSDRELESKEWISNIVGKASDWIYMDCPDIKLRNASFVALKEEMRWSSHLALQAIVVPPPTMNCQHYAGTIARLCASATHQQIWMKIPLVAPVSEDNIVDGWQLWDNFRQFCGHNHRISIILELPEDIPSELAGIAIQRWIAEPVKAIQLNTNSFLTNKSGYPVLSKSLQHVLQMFFEFKIQVIISGVPRHATNDGYLRYCQYIRHLKTKYCVTLSEGDKFTMSYRDTLQSPLQPLMDNLESQTYETFERDPIKYQRYEEAIAKALRDMHALRSSEMQKQQMQSVDEAAMSVEPGNDGSVEIGFGRRKEFTLVCTVVGAGRGPLVAATLNAACQSGVRVRIYAVEKNPNAIITLRNRAISEHWSNVEIVSCDMRWWEPKEKSDVLISELLGSFGDNELSPECLDGAQKCLKRDGVSIPQSYTSYLAPIATSKLWMCAADPIMMSGKGLESPYVVKLHNFFQLAEPQPLFTFAHPNWDDIIDNTRYKRVTFASSPVSMVMHGVAGYFHSVLYADVTLSILPSTHTPGMFSWFPFFIPLEQPVRVSKGDTIAFNIWRCVDTYKVWYEWCLDAPTRTQIQNSNGRSYFIGLH